MRFLHWLASPLVGTAGVCVALGLLAIPLHRLTSAPPQTMPAMALKNSQIDKIPTVLRLKLLSGAERVTVRDSTGATLLELARTAAGESEHDIQITLDNGHADLDLEVVFGETESAAFLTVMPDDHEDQTHYLIGSGTSSEILHFFWPPH
jgi:hypothetical protein